MKYKKLTAAILCIGMIFSFSVPVKAVTKEEIDEARQKAARTEQELENTNRKINDLESDKTELEEYLGELNIQLDDIGTQLKELGGRISEKELQLEITKSALERAKLDEEKQYEDMKARIRFMYEKGNKDLIVTLLSSESITKLLNRADQFEKITGYDRNKLEEYKETKEAVEAQETALEKEQEELLLLQNANEEKHRELETLVSETGIKLDGYLKKISEEELVASDLKGQVEKQKATLDELVRKAEQEKREAEERARREAELKRLAQQKAAEEEAARKEQKKKSDASSGEKSESKEKKEENPAENTSESQKQENANAEKDASEEHSGTDSSDESSGKTEPDVNSDDTEPEEETSSEEEPEEEAQEEKESSSGETYLGTFKVTAYCNCAKCCGRANQATASGVMPSSSHTVAMGGVPFGTKLRVGGRVYTVEDRGTPYGHVDIFFDSHAEALQFGLRYMEVYQLN